jgi:FMN reductase (NADPH)
MNTVIEVLSKRRSHRAFSQEAIATEDLASLKQATLRAPTAGNMMFYSVIEVTNQNLKEQLAVLCDNQPMIAKAPLVWLFLSDVRKWVDYYHKSGSVSKGTAKGITWRTPGAGDLLLAMSDALIAAQNAVVAAESLGIGSCYIGDILENHERIVQLFQLPRYTAVATLVIFGYPKSQEALANESLRCPSEAIFMENQYHTATLEELQQAYSAHEQRLREQNRLPFDNTGTIADFYYFKKHESEFMEEMNRSSKALIDSWLAL